MYAAIRVTKGTTVNKTYYPQIEKGSEATSWEPYTGGIPSPNPDYPQEIKSVVNPTVKVVGKNLWSGKHTENYWMGNNETLNTECISSDYIPIKGSQTIYAGFSYDWFVGFNCYDSKKNKILRSEQQINLTEENIEKEYKIVPSKVKTPENTAFIKFMFSKHESKPYISIVESTYEPYHEQTITLPYTLNAIPVSSGGNVTIDGQQYISDYVDVERGKLVRMIDSFKLDSTQSIVDKTEWLLTEHEEIDLTPEENAAFKALATYYPVTNININSEQLDGYTVFNYPVSMKNGWDYVKKQLNDNREYIYNMNIQAQDIDAQSAEAYVNSEYAVALTELEV